MIEVGDLLAQDEIFQQRRAAQPGLERILIVRNGHALIGCELLSGGVDAHSIQRPIAWIRAQRLRAVADFRRGVALCERARRYAPMRYATTATGLTD